MEIIILKDGLYHLYPVTKDLFTGATLPETIDCFSLCDVLRMQLTTFIDSINHHIMTDGGGGFFGCMCN